MFARALTFVASTIVAVALAGCGGDAASGIELSTPAEEGRTVMRSSGCAACHGANGDGGVGPSFVGLFGDTVELADGTSVTADRDYLRESIADPGAKLVEGYRVPMPQNDLDGAQIDAIIAYIVELADLETDG